MAIVFRVFLHMAFVWYGLLTLLWTSARVKRDALDLKRKIEKYHGLEKNESNSAGSNTLVIKDFY
jgi:hypothetical protein